MSLWVPVLVPLAALFPAYLLRRRAIIAGVISATALLAPIYVLITIPYSAVVLTATYTLTYEPIVRLFSVTLAVAMAWAALLAALQGDGRAAVAGLAMYPAAFTALLFAHNDAGIFLLLAGGFLGVLVIAAGRRHLQALLAGQQYIVHMGISGLSLLLVLPLAQQFEISREPYLLGLLLGLLLLGFGIRMGLFPFFSWLPVAAEQASGGGLALANMGVGTVSVPVLALFLGQRAWLASSEITSQAFFVIGLATVVAASALVAIHRSPNRMAAYSLVADYGYIAIGLAIGSPLALAAAFTSTLVQPLALFPLLFATEQLRASSATRRETTLAGLAALAGGLGIAGVPPFSGFLGRWLLYRALVEIHPGLVAVAMIGTSIVALSWLRAALPLLGGRQVNNGHHLWIPALVALLPALASLLIWLFPTPLVSAVSAAVSELPLANMPL